MDMNSLDLLEPLESLFCFRSSCTPFAFVCNDISGCPAPSLLSPRTLDLNQLKREVGWPAEGVRGLFNWQSLFAYTGYLLVNAILYRLLPAVQVKGTVLPSGGRLDYRLNTLNSHIAIAVALAAGQLPKEPTLCLIYAYSLATFVYIRSFSVKPGNKENRELAPGGQSGNLLYDWFIGRELNPRISLPFIGEIDLKQWLELRPGLLGWIVMDCACIILVTAFQIFYVFDSWWNEPAILTTIDIIGDGFGMMLAFADFTFEVLSNNEKNRFRTDMNDPKVAHLKFMKTKSGSRLLISGWWGVSRHVNYLGDWLQSWSFSLPTCLAGYQILAAGTGAEGAAIMKDGREVVQGDAKGWAIPLTYFYLIYFAVLLIHREGRDDVKCHRKYGEDWEKYKKIVRWRIIRASTKDHKMCHHPPVLRSSRSTGVWRRVLPPTDWLRVLQVGISIQRLVIPKESLGSFTQRLLLVPPSSVYIL
ncbi:unnamed protein product [Clonostachys rosea f. rosea IK726]|uniref:Uncharacterized protein n=1 Tax=Clonostachys rosea f. rosea IK726 TaxID=1349383 RepID=A0ACA9UFH2_BIOOC|nr:unnamed protein product [Clonostachys rosea f. rosea IK726]